VHDCNDTLGDKSKRELVVEFEECRVVDNDGIGGDFTVGGGNWNVCISDSAKQRMVRWVIAKHLG